MPAVLGAAALLALVLVVVLFIGRGRSERELSAARAELAALRTQMEALSERLTPRASSDDAAPRSQRAGRGASGDEPGYVITQVGDLTLEPRAPQPPSRIDRTLFADLLLRETVVRTASLAHGVRVALAPATRNRIRFEMRQEVRRARKLRRVELKEARRLLEDRQRAGLPLLTHADHAAEAARADDAGDAA